MKLATFEAGGRISVGVLANGGVVDLRDLLPGDSPQALLEALIDRFDELREPIERLAATVTAVPVETVRFHSAVPAPGKVLCVMRNRPGLATAAAPYAYLKYADGSVGTGQVLRLADEAADLRYAPELAAVIRGPARNVARSAWRSTVFGYTGFLDVVRPSSGLAPGDVRDNWSKSWDTPWASGPWVVTSDMVTEPGEGLRLRVTTSSESTDVADPGSPSLPELVEFLSSVMTLHTGDLIACGAHDAAVTPAVAGSRAELTMPEIGTLSVEVRS